MRFTPEILHPTIFEKFKEITQRASSGTVQYSPEETQAMSKHSSIWMTEYWKGFLVWILSCGIPIGAAMAARGAFGKGLPPVTAFFASALVPVALGIYLYQKNAKLVTLAELEAMKPALRLNEFESLYIDCFVLVQQSTLLDKDQKLAWSASLSEALDRVIQMQKLREEIRDLAMGFSSSDFLSEKRRLEEAISKSTDEVARATYQESLQLLNSRTDKVANAQVQLERIEAHIELSKHTFLRTKETIRSLQLTHRNESMIDLDSLRINLSRVDNDASQVVKAIQELREM